MKINQFQNANPVIPIRVIKENWASMKYITYGLMNKFMISTTGVKIISSVIQTTLILLILNNFDKCFSEPQHNVAESLSLQ